MDIDWVEVGRKKQAVLDKFLKREYGSIKSRKGANTLSKKKKRKK